MAGNIFINYRRDDARADARNIRDRLAQAFGEKHIFMDVDNLKPGQRFDQELAKVLGSCDVFLAVMGPRWLETLAQREKSGERDYVREEIATALKRGIHCIPVVIEGATLPAPGRLPTDIRDLVLHHKVDVGHATFGRDMAILSEGVGDCLGVKPRRPGKGIANFVSGLAKSAAAIAALAAVAFGLSQGYRYYREYQYLEAERERIAAENATREAEQLSIETKKAQFAETLRDKSLSLDRCNVTLFYSDAQQNPTAGPAQCVIRISNNFQDKNIWLCPGTAIYDYAGNEQRLDSILQNTAWIKVESGFATNVGANLSGAFQAAFQGKEIAPGLLQAVRVVAGAGGCRETVTKDFKDVMAEKMEIIITR